MASADKQRTPDGTGKPGASYVVPRYRAEGDPAFYHVLHGTVPGHQIDFMYCPEVPQGRLTQTHFGHLSRLMKYIEPRQGAPYAFALGNLSRDDVQHEPGHGGLALIFALRVAGVTDHAGRAMPPYAHGVVAIDRTLDHAALLQAISGFYRRFRDSGSRSEDATGNFYRAYVRVMQERPEAVESFLHEYIRDFDELPQPPQSTLQFDWEADEEALPRRVVIVHADDEPFESVAHAAALLGAMLYKSNIKWTTITSGREIEIPGGVSIRFVPASEMPRDGRRSGERDVKAIILPLADLPDREDALARQLFGAVSRAAEARVTRGGWREALAPSKEEDAPVGGVASTVSRASRRPPPEPPEPPAQLDIEVVIGLDEEATIPAPMEREPPTDSSSPDGGPQMPREAPAPAPGSKAPREPAVTEGPPVRSRLGVWIAIAGGLAVIVAIVAAMAGGPEPPSSGPSDREGPSARALTATVAPSSSGAPTAAPSRSSTLDNAPEPSATASTPKLSGVPPESSATEPSATEPSANPAVAATPRGSSSSKGPGSAHRPPGTGTKTEPSLRKRLRIPGQ